MLQRCGQGTGKGYQKRRKGFQICRKQEIMQQKQEVLGGYGGNFSIFSLEKLEFCQIKKSCQRRGI